MVNYKALAKVISSGEKTIEQLATENHWPIFTDGQEKWLVPEPNQWHAWDGYGDEKIYDAIEDNIECGEDAARLYVGSGDWFRREKTVWIRVRVWRVGIDSNGDVVSLGDRWYRVPLHPPQPPCIDEGGHDWQSPFEIVGGIESNPGVWSHGGGVVIHECCMKCGCARITDTWAQDPESGEQGLESVRYEPGRYAIPKGEEVAMIDIERELEQLPAEYHEPLSEIEMDRLAKIWRELAQEAGCLADYDAAGGFDWHEIVGSLPEPYAQYPEAWARRFLENDVLAIAAARRIWGLALIR